MGRDLRLVLLLPHRSPAFHLDLPYNAAPKPVLRGTTQSSLLAEQFGHRLFVRDCTRPAGSPLPCAVSVASTSACSRRSAEAWTLHRLKPPQVRKWDDRGCFAAQMDDLVGAGVARRGCSHATTVPRSSEFHTQPLIPLSSRSRSAVQANPEAYSQVAPRARLERATYCLGGLRGLCPDLPIARSVVVWRTRESPWFTAVHRPIGHTTGTRRAPARSPIIASPSTRR